MSSREPSPIPTKDTVYTFAREVFGDPRKAFSWMNTPNHTLNDMRPKDFIEYSKPEDLQIIMDELERVDQGLF